MKREEYFSFLKETTNAVRPILEKCVEVFKEIDKELYDILMVFTRNRLIGPLQKPALFRLAYELCGGKEWEKVIPAAVAFELINISSYQANSAFDDKLGILTKPQKDSQFIASMISRELSFKAASAIEETFGEQLATKIYSSLSMSNYYIYLAQHYDLNVLKTDKIENYNDEAIFFRDYRKRCFYGSGVINGQCAYIACLLAQGSNKQLTAIRGFGEQYGIALQMINDLGDYIPNNIDPHLQRTFQDQYSDFKNGRLTLPLYHLLKFGTLETVNMVRAIIKEKTFDQESLLKTTKLLVEEKTPDYIKQKAKHLVYEAQKHLDSFEDSSISALLKLMTSIILTNKYLAAFRKIGATDRIGSYQYV